MPRDSSGNYTLPISNPVVTDTTIASAWANTTLSDIATQLNGVVIRDGKLNMTGPLYAWPGNATQVGIHFGLPTSGIGAFSNTVNFFYNDANAPVAWTKAGGFAAGDFECNTLKIGLGTSIYQTTTKIGSNEFDVTNYNTDIYKFLTGPTGSHEAYKIEWNVRSLSRVTTTFNDWFGVGVNFGDAIAIGLETSYLVVKDKLTVIKGTGSPRIDLDTTAAGNSEFSVHSGNGIVYRWLTGLDDWVYLQVPNTGIPDFPRSATVLGKTIGFRDAVASFSNTSPIASDNGKTVYLVNNDVTISASRFSAEDILYVVCQDAPTLGGQNIVAGIGMNLFKSGVAGAQATIAVPKYGRATLTFISASTALVSVS
jgi:hypothetical protein